MAEAITITLGGREFTVRPLTFRQLRDVEEALGKAAKAGPLTRIDFDAAIDILVAAVSRAHPELTRDAILDFEGAKPEITAATNAILRLSGYVKETGAAPGEAAAGN